MLTSMLGSPEENESRRGHRDQTSQDLEPISSNPRQNGTNLPLSEAAFKNIPRNLITRSPAPSVFFTPSTLSTHRAVSVLNSFSATPPSSIPPFSATSTCCFFAFFPSAG